MRISLLETALPGVGHGGMLMAARIRLRLSALRARTYSRSYTHYNNERVITFQATRELSRSIRASGAVMCAEWLESSS